MDILKPTFQKEVKPAEIIVVTKSGIEHIENPSTLYKESKHDKHCVFEHIYFSRPDSVNFGENVFKVREKIGAILADADNFTADIVVPVPDSSNFIALGYAKRKNAPFQLGLIRNHYVGRTFIKPEQTVRDESVSQKFNVLPNFFPGKKVVLVDDSIVRGTTLRKLVKMIKSAGAKEVHLRIGSPPVKHSCYYGIDTPTGNELIANTKTLEEIKEYTGADTLRYLEIPELEKCVSEPKEYCYACFNGDYPKL